MRIGMESPLRPDLGRILPLPALRRHGGADGGAGANGAPLLEQSLVLAASRPAEDFLIDVRRPDDHDADAPGFGIAQALAVAERVAAWFRREPEPAATAQRPSHERVRPFLGD
jgi:hypothetical protein